MIQNPIIELFDNVNANQVNVSNGRCLTLNYAWELEIIKTGTNGNPKLIIERSLDDINYSNYVESCFGDLILDEAINTITDDSFPGVYFRIRTEPNGTTTGTITAKLRIKIRN